MQRIQKFHGIVIKSVNFSEADKILTVFTRERGLIKIFAKGVRKMESKNRSGVQTLSYNTFIVYPGKNMYHLRRGENLYTPDYANMEQLNIHRVLNLMTKLVPEDSAEQEVFDVLLKLLRTDFDAEKTNRFMLLALRYFGYLPDLKTCSVCGEQLEKGAGLSLNPVEMTSVCTKCAQTAQNPDSYIPINSNFVPDQSFTAVLDRFINKVLE